MRPLGSAGRNRYVPRKPRVAASRAFREQGHAMPGTRRIALSLFAARLPATAGLGLDIRDMNSAAAGAAGALGFEDAGGVVICHCACPTLV